MAGGIFKKVFGGERDNNLDSCCGAVSVTAEEETTSENETKSTVEVSPEPLTHADR